MCTTLNIDDDLLLAVKEVARRDSKTVGATVSGLLRAALLRGGDRNGDLATDEPAGEFGFRPFPARGGLVTNDLINRLRDEIGD